MDNEAIRPFLFCQGVKEMTVYKKGGPPNPFLSDRKELRKLDEDLSRYLNDLDQNLDAILNTGINFNENFDAVFVSGTSDASAGTEKAFTHDLGKVPTGFIVTSLSNGAVLYNGTTSNTASTIYIRSTQNSTVFTVLVF